METKQCKMCQYFIQHYGLGKEKLFRIHCGHCVLGKAKRKKPDTPACESFVPGQDRENAFADREFLSKELLKHVLEMDLLPQIEE